MARIKALRPFKALSFAGILKPVGNFLAEDAEMEIRGAGAMDGHWRGHHQIVEAARANFAMVTGQKPEMQSAIFQWRFGGRALHESGMFKHDERCYRVRAVQWFTLCGRENQAHR